MGTSLNILIIDDDLDDHELFREAVSEIPLISYHIDSVMNGSEALNLLKEKIDSTGASILPDFIVLDLNMPIMNGFETLKALKNDKSFDKIPVYILTTSWTESHMNKCKALGATGYFTKPSRLSELNASIRKMIVDLKQ